MRYPAILAAAAALAGAATVFAAPAAAEDSVGIKYSDLDLSTRAGQQKLERRIDGAAREACGMDQIRTGRFTPSTAQRECYQKTKASVGEQVAQMIARDTPRG
jgi:UrcA family protein